MTHVGFALPKPAWLSDIRLPLHRNLLKTYILMTGYSRAQDWHVPCKSRSGTCLELVERTHSWACRTKQFRAWENLIARRQGIKEPLPYDPHFVNDFLSIRHGSHSRLHDQELREATDHAADQQDQRTG